MSRAKKILLPLIFLMCFSPLLLGKEDKYTKDSLPNTENSSSNIMYNSNRFTQMDEKSEYKQNSLVDLVNYHKISESENLILYVKQDDLSIRIQNKVNGYIWGSSFHTENERLNKIWRSRVDSGIWITYFRKTEIRDEAIEESITTSEKTTVKTQIQDRGFSSHIVFGNSKIELDFIVTLHKDDTLTCEVPISSIKETSENFLGAVKIYPFLGAIKTTADYKEMEGYTVIPDGSGSLIRYQFQDATPLPIYSKQIYSRDIGLYDLSEDPFVNQGNHLQIPVYGMVHGIDQNAFYAHSKSGSEYGRIVSYEAGRTTDFYWTFFEYIYRIQYQKPISKTQSIVSTQNEKNAFDIKIDYRFTENEKANYVGIAKDYQEKLIREELAQKNYFTEQKSIPIRLEFLMSETKKGLLSRKKVCVTTTDQVLKILNDLKEQNIENIELILKGWSKKGYYGTSPDYFGFDSESGGKKGYRELMEYCRAQNISLYFSADYTKFYEGSSGISKMTDLARNIKGDSMDGKIGQYTYYYINPLKTQKVYEEDLKTYQKYQMEHLALEELGNNLYSSWTKNFISSSKTIEIYRDMAKKNLGKNAFYGTNEYILKQAHTNFDAAFYSSGYALFTDTIPFVNIVYDGLVGNFSLFINQFSNPKDEILRLIDYKIYPTFNLTFDSSQKLQNTPSSYLSSTQYEVWRALIIQNYQFMNTGLNQVMNARLLNRSILSPGVVKNTYDNQTVIYLNYLNQAVTFEGVNIPSKSFQICEGNV